MITKAQIKTYKALKQKKYRDESGLFVVEGEKMTQEALASDFEVVEVITDKDAIAQISSLTTPPEKIAIVRKPEMKAAAGALENDIYIALDSIRDPGNLGTILRLCDWFGVRKIFMSQDTVDIYNPKVVQSTMGSIFRVDYEYCDLQEVCREFAKCGSVVGTFLGGENLYGTSLKEEPTLIVIGSESFGISQEIGALCTKRVTIPSFGSPCESLNAAIATAITISHYRSR